MSVGSARPALPGWAETPEDFKEQTAKALCALMENENVDRKQLAEWLGRTSGQVSSMLSARGLTLKTIADVAEALGYAVGVVFVPHGINTGPLGPGVWNPVEHAVLLETVEELRTQLAEEKHQVQTWAWAYAEDKLHWQHAWRDGVFREEELQRQVRELGEKLGLAVHERQQAQDERDKLEVDLDLAIHERREAEDERDELSQGMEEAAVEREDLEQRLWGEKGEIPGIRTGAKRVERERFLLDEPDAPRGRPQEFTDEGTRWVWDDEDDDGDLEDEDR